MARRKCKCSDCDDHRKQKDFRHDHGSDGFDETPYRKKSSSPVKKRTGCPGNDGGAHVYVWEKDFVWESYWNSFTGTQGPRPYHYEYKICCGCDKRFPGRKGFKRVPN